MKTLIKGKIVSAGEAAKLITTDDSEGITYSDIQRMFSNEDLKEYNRLCRNLLFSIGNKSRSEQWDMLLDPVTGLNLVSILNRIEELRSKYNLPGTFYRLWQVKPLSNGKLEYDEVSW
jgi:hypothetical protein